MIRTKMYLILKPYSIFCYLNRPVGVRARTKDTEVISSVFWGDLGVLATLVTLVTHTHTHISRPVSVFLGPVFFHQDSEGYFSTRRFIPGRVENTLKQDSDLGK